MKHFLLAVLLVVSLSTSSFAGNTNKINYAILSNFSTDFKNAFNVIWTPSDYFAKATFMVNDQQMEAFYQYSGEIIGTSKNISLDDLPVGAKRTFAKRFDGYTVKEAIRFEGTDEGAFYISAENDRYSVILKINDNGLVSVFKKTNK